jgi:hypothetical protein
MVEDIEGLRTELELQCLMDREFPSHSQVHLPHSKTSRKISRCITACHARGTVERRTPRWWRKRARINGSPSWVLGPIQVQRLSRYQTQARLKLLARTGIEDSKPVQSDRETRTGGEPVVDAPAAQNCAGNSISRWGWQVVRQGG